MANETEKVSSFLKLKNPEALIVVSGGTVLENKSDVSQTWRSTTHLESDAYGILWGEARMQAAYQLGLQFPNSKLVTTSRRLPVDIPSQTHASVIASELIKKGIHPDRIILEELSVNSPTQMGEMFRLSNEFKWSHVVIVSNLYQLPRLKAIYKYFDKIKGIPDEERDAWHAFRKRGVVISFIGAESVLSKLDKDMSVLVDEVIKSEPYLKRISSEQKGIEDIIAGRYKSNLSIEYKREINEKI